MLTEAQRARPHPAPRRPDHSRSSRTDLGDASFSERDKAAHRQRTSKKKRFVDASYRVAVDDATGEVRGLAQGWERVEEDGETWYIDANGVATWEPEFA